MDGQCMAQLKDMFPFRWIEKIYAYNPHTVSARSTFYGAKVHSIYNVFSTWIHPYVHTYTLSAKYVVLLTIGIQVVCNLKSKLHKHS